MPCRVGDGVAVSRDDGLRSRHFYLRVCVKEVLQLKVGLGSKESQGWRNEISGFLLPFAGTIVHDCKAKSHV